MFESFMAVPLHFTLEFLGFLVMAGGAFLVWTRPVLIPGGAQTRRLAATGFASLAAAQVVHGGSFIERDGDQILLALRGFGWFLILVALTGAARSGFITGASAELFQPLALAPAGLALVVALVAGTHSFREGPRTWRRLALGSFGLAAGEALLALARDITIGEGVRDVYAYSSHGLRLLGFIALASWLWSSVRASIRTRFVASFAGLLVGVMLAISSALTGVITSNVEDEELRRVDAQAANVVRDIREDQDDLIANLTMLASNQQLTEAASAGTPADLTRLAETTLTTFDFDFVLFLKKNGELTAFAGEGPTARAAAGPTALEDDDRLRIVGSPIIKRDIVEGSSAQSAGLDLLSDSKGVFLVQLAASELTLANRRVGIIVAGRYLDAFDAEGYSASFKPARVTLIGGGEVVASELPGRIKIREVLPPNVRQSVEGGRTITRQHTIGSESYFSAFAPLGRGSGVPAGIVALSSPARIVTETREGVTRTLFLVAMGVGAIALLLAWFSGRRITRPIQLLTRTAAMVREGNLSVKAPVVGDDEVGQLGSTFNEMTSSLLAMTDELRDAARQEQELRGRIETIIQSMADGLVAVDTERRVLAFNREAEHLTGLKAARVLGKPIDKVLDVRDAQGNPVGIPIFELAEGSMSGVALAKRSGDNVPIAVTSAVIRGEDGAVAGGVAVLRDMTREREIERMKSEFLSNISHELRTPLTPIKGYAEIMGRRDVPPEKVKQFSGGILESTARLERIVELLVDFAAVEAGRLSPHIKPVDMGALVTDLAREWKGKAARHDVEVEIKPRLPKVIGDERLLKRSIEEVLDNAVKFSPDGGSIRLEARATTSSNGLGRRRAVEVSILDEGIGIPPEDIPKIFSDFQQLDGSETRTYGGLGLGLSFVQRIVEVHDGKLKVESEVDEGTRLTITLPAATRARVSEARGGS